jgi:hypothetical protein
MMEKVAPLGDYRLTIIESERSQGELTSLIAKANKHPPERETHTDELFLIIIDHIF